MATPSSILAWRIPWTESMATVHGWGRKEWGVIEVTEHRKWRTNQECSGCSLFSIFFLLRKGKEKNSFFFLSY